MNKSFRRPGANPTSVGSRYTLKVLVSVLRFANVAATFREKMLPAEAGNEGGYVENVFIFSQQNLIIEKIKTITK